MTATVTQTNNLTVAVNTAVAKAVNDPSVPANAAAIQPITQSVVDQLLPAIEQLVNNKEWYKSQVFWGVVIASGFTVAKPFLHLIMPGYILPDQAEINDFAAAGATLGQAVGFGVILYGRFKTKKLEIPSGK